MSTPFHKIEYKTHLINKIYKNDILFYLLIFTIKLNTNRRLD